MSYTPPPFSSLLTLYPSLSVPLTQSLTSLSSTTTFPHFLTRQLYSYLTSPYTIPLDPVHYMTSLPPLTVHIVSSPIVFTSSTLPYSMPDLASTLVSRSRIGGGRGVNGDREIDGQL